MLNLANNLVGDAGAARSAASRSLAGCSNSTCATPASKRRAPLPRRVAAPGSLLRLDLRGRTAAPGQGRPRRTAELGDRVSL